MERRSQGPGGVHVQVNHASGVRANGWGGMSAPRVAWLASSSRALPCTFHFPLKHVWSLNLFYTLMLFVSLYSGILFRFSGSPLSLPHTPAFLCFVNSSVCEVFAMPRPSPDSGAKMPNLGIPDSRIWGQIKPFSLEIHSSEILL